MKSVLHKPVFFLTLFVLLAIPNLMDAASVQITEVMYSPEEADSGHEWIEVKNVSNQQVDFSSWNFRENETDHRLTASSESVLPSGEFAVIVQDTAKFRTSFSGSSGILFDSSFGLRNEGESVKIINSSGTVVDSLHYDPGVGADGNGNSLQLHSGSWLEAKPTPGEANTSESAAPPAENNGGGSSGSGSESKSASVYVLQSRQKQAGDTGGEVAGVSSDKSGIVTVDAGSNIQAIANVPVRLAGVVEASRDNLLADRSIRWSLGNGDIKEGVDIFYTYNHPGEYKATLSVSSATTSFSDAVTVDVVSADVAVTDTKPGRGGYITVENKLSRDLDLSGWHLVDGSNSFTFPAHTSILAGKQITVENNISGLSGSRATKLWYPDGTPVNQEAKTEAESNQVFSRRVAYNGGVSREDNEASQSEVTVAQSRTSEDERTKKENKLLTDVFPSSSQPAAVAEADNDMFFRWITMLMAVLAVALGGIVFMRRFAVTKDNPEIVVDRVDVSEI